MASTNSTTNYGLPQWLATDKPERTDLNTAFDALDTNLNLVQEGVDLKANKTQGEWITPALLNGWVAFDASRIPMYRIDEFSNLQIKGMAKSGTINANIFTLPTGYIPSRTINIAGSSNNLFGNFQVQNPTGNVLYTTGNNTWVSLEAIISLG